MPFGAAQDPSDAEHVMDRPTIAFRAEGIARLFDVSSRWCVRLPLLQHGSVDGVTA